MVFDEVASTQDVARDHASSERPVVVVSRRQSSGRGRAGSTWDTAPGAVAVSVAFDPAWSKRFWPLISLVAGVAAVRAIETPVGLKWPNDLVVDDAKVGGILVEAGGEAVVAGMGLNLYWPRPPAGVAGLFDAPPDQVYAVSLGRRWAEALLDLVARSPDMWPRREYLAASATVGRQVVWEPAGAGRAVGIGEDGSLIVETPEGEFALASGEVRHVRPA